MAQWAEQCLNALTNRPTVLDYSLQMRRWASDFRSPRVRDWGPKPDGLALQDQLNPFEGTRSFVANHFPNVYFRSDSRPTVQGT